MEETCPAHVLAPVAAMWPSTGTLQRQIWKRLNRHGAHPLNEQDCTAKRSPHSWSQIVNGTWTQKRSSEPGWRQYDRGLLRGAERYEVAQAGESWRRGSKQVPDAAERSKSAQMTPTSGQNPSKGEAVDSITCYGSVAQKETKGGRRNVSGVLSRLNDGSSVGSLASECMRPPAMSSYIQHVPAQLTLQTDPVIRLVLLHSYFSLDAALLFRPPAQSIF